MFVHCTCSDEVKHIHLTFLSRKYDVEEVLSSHDLFLPLTFVPIKINNFIVKRRYTASNFIKPVAKHSTKVIVF